MDIVIRFDADGTGTCLATDALPLAEIGRLSMRRASNVEWNEARQQWEVTLPGDKITVLCAHPNRTVCLEWERAYFNERIAKGES